MRFFSKWPPVESPISLSVGLGLYTNIIRVKEYNENYNKCIGLFTSGIHLEFVNDRQKIGFLAIFRSARFPTRDLILVSTPIF